MTAHARIPCTLLARIIFQLGLRPHLVVRWYPPVQDPGRELLTQLNPQLDAAGHVAGMIAAHGRQWRGFCLGRVHTQERLAGYTLLPLLMRGRQRSRRRGAEVAARAEMLSV